MFPNNNNNNRNNVFDNNDPNSFNNSNNNNNLNNLNFNQQFTNEMNPINPNISSNNNLNPNNFGPQPGTSNLGFRHNYNLNTTQQEQNNSMPATNYNLNQLGIGLLNRADPNMNNYQANNLGNNQTGQGLNALNNLPFPKRGTVNLSALGMDMNQFNNIRLANNLNEPNNNFNSMNNMNFNNNYNENNYNNFGGMNQSAASGNQIPPMFYNTMRNDPNLVNRFFEIQNNMQNLNTQNEEEMRLRQEEEMQRMLEDEMEMQKLKDQMKNYFKSNKNIAYIKQDLFSIRRSEYFNERDRYFFEELIQLPLKTSGFLGLGNVMLDKAALFADKSKGKMNAGFNQEKNYFDKQTKDGVYLDYVKQKVYSYNLQKLEQRLLREVFFLSNNFIIKKFKQIFLFSAY